MSKDDDETRDTISSPAEENQSEPISSPIFKEDEDSLDNQSNDVSVSIHSQYARMQLG